MNDEELGPQPDPVIEEKEPNPGGADALPDDRARTRASPATSTRRPTRPSTR